MKTLPESFTQTLFIVAERDRGYEGKPEYEYKVRLSGYNPEEGPNTMGYILLGTHTVTVDVPECNPLQGEIDALKKVRASILAEAQVKANQISERIEQLQCITHDKG